jgi:hypothetical protein
MWDDDFDAFDQPIDDGEAFNNTLVIAGENLVDELLQRRAAQLAHLSEADFVSLFDLARTIVDEWLPPSCLAELWHRACWWYHEHRKEKEPRISAKICEKVMQEVLPAWYKIVQAEEGRQRQEKKAKPKKRRMR